MVFCRLSNWSAWSLYNLQIPRGGNCLLLPVTGYAHEYLSSSDLLFSAKDCDLDCDGFTLIYRNSCLTSTDILHAVDHGDVAAQLVLLDMLVAFYTVDHSILLQRPVQTTFLATPWFRSYRSCRTPRAYTRSSHYVPDLQRAAGVRAWPSLICHVYTVDLIRLAAFACWRHISMHGSCPPSTRFHKRFPSLSMTSWVGPARVGFISTQPKPSQHLIGLCCQHISVFDNWRVVVYWSLDVTQQYNLCHLIMCCGVVYVGL